MNLFIRNLPKKTKKNLLRLLNWAGQMGMDPIRALRFFGNLPRYFVDYFRFLKTKPEAKVYLNPYLHDRHQQAGQIRSEYFWQDLIVARWIYEAKPRKHVDVGSRVDGFVSHVASFRELEVLDLRSLATSIPGVKFRQIDLMSSRAVDALVTEGGYCDSLSCLHALEHFGLGRYGDPLDASGYRRGIVHLAALLEPRGTLYLATPLGRERIEFNANWVFAPDTILKIAAENHLHLIKFLTFNHYTGLAEINLEAPQAEFRRLAQAPYHLGIFQFRKEK